MKCLSVGHLDFLLRISILLSCLWLSYETFVSSGLSVSSVRHHRRRQYGQERPSCKNELTIGARKELADAVFTGTVIKILLRNESNYYDDGTGDNGSFYSCKIRVKRTIKGRVVKSVPKSVPSSSFLINSARAKRFRGSNEVVVHGFGNPAICRNNIKEKDTRIFMVDISEFGHLVLNSSLIRVTLKNLDLVLASDTDIPYKPRPPIEEEPCEKTFCAFGSVCVVDDVTKDAYCKCQETCGTVFAPVCGTDGITYTSECHLRLASCTKQKRIVVRHTGSCHVKDPCDVKECPYGASCVSSLDGRSAECVCPDKCASYGDNRGSNPVCGSDGRDYGNMCELRKAACHSMKELFVKFQGKCDPCEGVLCSSLQVCQLDENRNPVCRCNGVCTMDFRPVCGSDGKTYSNECVMRVEACKARTSLRIIYWGECKTNPCDSVTCSNGKVCDIDRYGIATCHCPSTCELVMRPVCGNDDVTYDNECEMKRAACVKERDIHVQYRGVCGSEGPCNTVQCNFGAICVVKGEEAVCECPACSAEFRPVCGSDGISYNNECKLKQEGCLQKKEISVAYEGLCNGCENKRCQFYSICESDGLGDANCVCPQSCVQVDAKVCGSDGVTYENECQLKVSACRKKHSVTVAQHGTCDLCLNVHCKFGAKCENGQCICPTECPDKLDPICTKEGITYPSECHLHKVACQNSREPESYSYGECDDVSGSEDTGSGSHEECDEDTCRFGGICEYDAQSVYRCLCTMNCHHAARMPVCGTDGQIYPNDCELTLHACRHQLDIKMQSMDACGEFGVVPCDGAAPLINPATGRDYNCRSDGAPSEMCPAGSYCHSPKHGTFAKCCKDKDSEAAIKSCSESRHGCCPDSKTAALGPGHAGCPSLCKCNKLGSYGETCDAVTRQCSCKPGVGGLRCDRCEPGFWGLPKISEGNSGCIPCGCSVFGSVRDDCEQMTGRCVCKPGVSGMKCNDCPEGHVLGPNGCSEDLSTPAPQSCEELQCFFGAKCEDHGEHPECICDAKCTEPANKPVCGSDNQTYGSECQLRLFACRYQKDIVVRALAPCESPFSGTTEPPFRRSTMRRTTDLAEYNSLSKSTRHLAHNSIPENLISTKPTSAAPLVKGIVGDICFRDKECTVPFTRCRDGWCDCRDGYYPSPDRHNCHAHPLSSKVTPETPTSVCSSQPCLNGGICHAEGRSTYRCICPPGIKGQFCEDVPMYDIPAFSGKSYLELKKLRAYSQVTIDMEFRTYANDGILLYNGQKPDGSGDFISLSIKNGFVEFRYNLGSGPVVIRSLHKVRMKKYHRVVAKRFHRDGMLRLDNQEDVAGRSQGMLKSLDLKQNLYIGYVPGQNKAMFESIGVNMGLVGCIRRLKIGRKDVHLKHPGSKDILKSIDVGECGENPCVSMPCQNGGTCIPAIKDQFKCICLQSYTGKVCETALNPCSPDPCTHGSTCVVLPAVGHVCMCPPGRKGERCEELKPEAHDVFIPNFIGSSFIKLPTIQNVGNTFSAEVWFMTRSPNGLLLYVGQMVSGRGDFVSLNLVNGHPQFRFNLGSGPANVTSSRPIELGEWHSVKINRFNRKGTMQINNGPLIQGESVVSSSTAPRNELNIEQPLFVGGFKSLQTLNIDSGVESGLDGAIQRLIINGEVYENLLERAISTHDVGKYDGPPCQKNMCRNGGICIPLLREFTCKCPMNFVGKLCEKNTNEIDIDQPVAFNGSTYLKYMNKINKKDNESFTFEETELTEFDNDDYELESNDSAGVLSQGMNKFDIRFRSSKPNGILLWMNKGSNLKGDYLVIALVDGYVEFAYNLGKQKTFTPIRSKVRVDDGRWHLLVIERKKRLGTLQIDNETPLSGTADPGTTILNTNGAIWIGGFLGLPPGLPVQYYSGFSGCIATVSVDSEQLHLVTHGDNNVEFCPND